MRRISYAETVLGTDGHLADLVLEYATLLARSGSADTVTIPCRIGTRDVEAVSILVGPASQMTSWADDEPFDVDVHVAVEDLERRIAAAGGRAGAGARSTDRPVDPDQGPGVDGIDEFDELA